MEKKFLKDLPVYQFANLSGHFGVFHAVTTRLGGFSSAELAEMNLSFAAGEPKEKVMQNRILLAEAFQIPVTNLLFPAQTHSSNLQVVNAETEVDSLKQTDALITAEKNLAVAVLVADCVPLLLYDPQHSVVAAVHAGWRGTVQQIVKKTIAKMVEVFGCDPKSILVGIGPSISTKNYEVGPEVLDLVRKNLKHSEQVISNGKKGKGFLDVPKSNYHQLLESGVLEKNIELADICTFDNPAEFYSSRFASGKVFGRFAGVIGLRS
jgi:YfiH family protein